MGYANKEDAKYVVDASLAADSDSPDVDVRNQLSGFFEIVWTGASVASDATVKLQEKGVNGAWVDIAGAVTAAFGAAGGTKVLKVIADVLQAPLIRAVVLHGTETVGTVKISYFFKGAR